jgi:transposase InsO family protein
VVIERIREIWFENRQVYDSPRIHADLRLKYGIPVGRKRVARLMREAGISGLVRRKRGRTTISVPGVRVADDLVGRQFRPAAPNVPWIADVTYLRTWEGWLYLAAVQDAYSRRIVGWSMADHTARPRPHEPGRSRPGGACRGTSDAPRGQIGNSPLQLARGSKRLDAVLSGSSP